jgi:hypothetical protein
MRRFYSSLFLLCEFCFQDEEEIEQRCAKFLSEILDFLAANDIPREMVDFCGLLFLENVFYVDL